MILVRLFLFFEVFVVRSPLYIFGHQSYTSSSSSFSFPDIFIFSLPHQSRSKAREKTQSDPFSLSYDTRRIRHNNERNA
jgi:hypothetical protein